MNADRSLLDTLVEHELADRRIKIEAAQGDVRTYTLVKKLGTGKTGVAWQATDSLDRPWAIKFVLKDDYKTHSLAAEAKRVAKLTTNHLAHIEFFGVPSISDSSLNVAPFYAIVVEWVPGQSLKDFLTENKNLTVKGMLRFARTLCEVVADLRENGLSHNDLHDGNIIIAKSADPLTREIRLDAKVIDTGTLKTEERRIELVEGWQGKLADIQAIMLETKSDLSQQAERLKRWIGWFGRSDQEWIVYHLCQFSNALYRQFSLHDAPTKRFLWRLPPLLEKMIDPDLSRRLADPALMYKHLESLWTEASQPEAPKMTSPFDLMSAELIRSDRQLRDLFSVEFPGLQECQGSDPIYLYGPRGCGKSTILRAISIKAMLSLSDPADELKKLHSVGVYLACSAELRSRFWLIPPSDYEITEPNVVRFFNLLLAEQLADTLEGIHLWDKDHATAPMFGMSDEQAIEICRRFRSRIGIDEASGRFALTSPFAVLKLQLRRERDTLWGRILDREPSAARADGQLVFDLCSELADCSPFFRDRQIAFLLDDYSKQRIPVALQRKLNQAITFSKQGNPIFKVTSEYGGVDLDGIQEGREVREVNIGMEYVDLADSQRWRFLKNVLEKRFAYLKKEVDLLTVMPFSGISPGVPMAKELKRCHQERQDFHYHGLDTISDLCSGDFAMGLDLVRRIFERANVAWQTPSQITPKIQDAVIRRYSSQEFEYIRYLAPHGRQQHEVVDALCWLAKESVNKRTTKKEGESIPLIKIHLDIAEPVLAQLEQDGGDPWKIFQSLTDKAILFPIDTSRARQAGQGTRRYQVRRILLARYGSPLGRHTPVRIDDFESMRFLLTEPREFVKHELERGAEPKGPSLFD